MACLAALSISAPVPEAEPKAFVNLGAVALPAITGSALIDGLLLGKVAFLKGKLTSGCVYNIGCWAGQKYNWMTPATSHQPPAIMLGSIHLESAPTKQHSH